MFSAGTLAAASAAPHLKSRRKEESKPESVGTELIQVTTLKAVESTEEGVVRVKSSIYLVLFFTICGGF